MNTSLTRIQFEFPVFPVFKKLEFEDKEYISPYLNQFLPYSDFSLVSLLCNDLYQDITYSWLNNNLVIRFRDYVTKTPFYSFIGTNKTFDTAEELLNYSKSQNIPQELRLVPEITIDELISSNINDYSIVEDRDQYDYIIPLKDTIDLSNINKHKQEAYQNFISFHPEYEVRILDISNYEIEKKLIELFEIWMHAKNKSIEDVEDELIILKRLISLNTHFKFTTIGLYIGSDLVGFVIDERLKSPFVLGHYIKANIHFKGVYEVINKVSAELHFAHGYKYINIEQDLGIEGLRISKMQRSPEFFLKKYKISYNNNI